MMDDAALETKGVSALGARRKLIKVFETVRQQTGMAPPDGSNDTLSPSKERARSASPGASSIVDASSDVEDSMSKSDAVKEVNE